MQDYNLSKLLQRKTSIPSTTDVYNEGKVHLNIIYWIQMDIENYNYISVVFHDWRNGRLTDEVKKREYENVNQEEDKSAMKLHPCEVLLTLDAAPSGMIFYRNNVDLVNNFYIDLVAKAFTNILEVINQNMEEKEQQNEEESIENIKKVKDMWRGMLMGHAEKKIDDLDSVFKTGFEKIKKVKAEDKAKKIPN